MNSGVPVRSMGIGLAGGLCGLLALILVAIPLWDSAAPASSAEAGGRGGAPNREGTPRGEAQEPGPQEAEGTGWLARRLACRGNRFRFSGNIPWGVLGSSR